MEQDSQDAAWPGRPSGPQLTEADPAFRDDPHSLLDWMREHAPVYRDDEYGFYFLTRYEDCRRVLTDRTLWRDPDKAEAAAVYIHASKGRSRADDHMEGRDNSILLMDEPEHSRIRHVVALALNSRILSATGVIEQIVQDKLAALERRHAFDLVEDYAAPIPIEVIAGLMGLELRDVPQFRAWSEAILKIFHPARTRRETFEMISARRGFLQIVGALLEARKLAPRDDLISDLAQLQASGAAISDAEIRFTCLSLMVAGNMTTSDLIGNSLYLLLTHPDQMALLKANYGLMPALIEEVLRFEPPGTGTARIASRDLDLRGCPVARSQAMVVCIRAANRDPAAYANPHVFDITRPHVPHLTFGGGDHYCIGAALARLEAQVAIRSMLERFPQLAIAAPAHAPVWRTQPYVHGLVALELLTEDGSAEPARPALGPLGRATI
ncbi:cytochrome P450 [Phenylobacterium sp.]|uniref:cytochrome P450 n=1 Tax=Phenylobacterium sp. TaxID=1871053 RepID=UPI0025FB49FB|nr:cytochrome P450 [Phenylobacterium sp.]MCA3586092.1 cytochrome P450 [Methylocystis sp.]MCA6346412.1 cytochrome P450 [Phenylobacterium sp.]MCA6355396.1 cytochrome P450 [Phenylobacterium sp.]MCA6358257.1 cytochrome P450 [Phenylobacterium sp.]MCA6361386.1 cytochrome P450 [Phenylobacterium sp.]